MVWHFLFVHAVNSSTAVPRSLPQNLSLAVVVKRGKANLLAEEVVVVLAKPMLRQIIKVEDRQKSAQEAIYPGLVSHRALAVEVESTHLRFPDRAATQVWEDKYRSPVALPPFHIQPLDGAWASQQVPRLCQIQQ